MPCCRNQLSHLKNAWSLIAKQTAYQNTHEEILLLPHVGCSGIDILNNKKVKLVKLAKSGGPSYFYVSNHISLLNSEIHVPRLSRLLLPLLWSPMLSNNPVTLTLFCNHRNSIYYIMKLTSFHLWKTIVQLFVKPQDQGRVDIMEVSNALGTRSLCQCTGWLSVKLCAALLSW